MNKISSSFTVITILLIIIFSNCRTMMINQTAETLKPKQMESTFYNGIGTSIYTITPSIKLQFGYQQRFGLSKNIEFQFFIFNEFDFSVTTFLSNNLKLSPKFRVFHTDKYHIAILPSVGVYNVLQYFSLTKYFGPYTGLTIIASHNIIKDRFSIYYGIGADVGESFLLTYTGTYLVDRTKSFLIDFSIGTSLGFEVIKNNFVTRHELGATINFDLERDYNEQFTFLNQFIVSFVYGFSIGGRYPRQTIED